MAKRPKKPEGISEFSDLLQSLAAVPKGELDAQVRKYERRKAAKKAAATKPKRRGR